MSENGYGQNNQGNPTGQGSEGQSGSWAAPAQQGQNTPPAPPVQNYDSSYAYSSPVGYEPAAKPAGSGLALASMILGIVGLPLSFVFGTGGILGLLAIILGIVAFVKLRKVAAAKKGMAITGIVLGSISLVLGIMMAIFTIFLFEVGSDAMQHCSQYVNDNAAFEQCVTEWTNDNLSR